MEFSAARRDRPAPSGAPAPQLLPVATSIALPLAVLAAAWLPRPAYSPDSWSYVELARSLGTDPFRISTWRAYGFDAPYSAAFPPLWPAILAVAEVATGAGPIVGLLCALAAFALFCLVAEQLGRALGARWCGGASAIAMAADPSFVDEIAAGRAMPLHLLLIAILALVFLRGNGGWRSHVLIGLTGGLAVMNRFDALPVAAGSVALAALRWRNLRGLVVCVGVVVLALSPWIAYSLLHFGVPFVSDNSFVAASVDQLAFVTDFVAGGAVTLRDDPAAWLAKVVANVRPLLAAQLRSALEGPWWLFFVFALRIAVAAIWRGRAPLPAGWGRLGWATLFLLPLLLPGATYVTTGYFDHRYFAPVRWWLLFLAFAAATLAGDRIGRGALVVLAIVAVLATQGPEAARNIAAGRLMPPPDFADPPLHHTLRTCLQDQDASRILFSDDIASTRYGALTGHTALLLPRNWPRLSLEHRAAFLTRFGVTHVLFGQFWDDRVFPPGFALEQTPCPLPLFELVRTGAAQPAQRGS